MHQQLNADSKGGIRKQRKSTAAQREMFEAQTIDDQREYRRREEIMHSVGSKEELDYLRAGFGAPVFSISEEYGDDFKENEIPHKDYFAHRASKGEPLRFQRNNTKDSSALY